ncbi:hypothetical protein PC112_g6196 [Phytophthora cactorum]|nr:hypothetical protein PC112_g6196 [Phytophthora cactorum]
MTAPAKYVPNNLTFAVSFYARTCSSSCSGGVGGLTTGTKTWLIVLPTLLKQQQLTPAWPHAAEMTPEQRLELLLEGTAKTTTALSAVLILALVKPQQAGSSNTKLVAVLMRSQGCTSENANMTIVAAHSIDAGAVRDRDQVATAVQHPINELDARGAGVGHQRTADRDAHVDATCGVDVEVIGGEDDVDDPVAEAVRGRGQVTSARRQEHGNAGVVRIVRGEDGGENSDGGSGQQHASACRARPDDVADTSSQQDAGHIVHNIETRVAVINATRSTTPGNRNPSTPTIEQLYYNKMVAF